MWNIGPHMTGKMVKYKHIIKNRSHQREVTKQERKGKRRKLRR
jgi:hypothetical protein